MTMTAPGGTSTQQQTVSIRETVRNVLSPAHLTYAEPAIRACEEREGRIAQALIEKATSDFDVSRGDVEQILRDCGLTVPAGAAASMGASGDVTLEGIAAQLQQINSRLDRASQQASRHGITF